MPASRDQALCIRHWDWSETSQTVSLFTRSLGLIRGIAKGARRDKAPFSGGIELLTRGEVVAIVKPQSDLATITAWDLQETFPALRRSLASFHAAMYLADLTRHAVHDRDPHPTLFDALLAALRDIEHAAPAVLRYLWTTLVECGYRPELDRDVVSSTPLDHLSEIAFVPSLGGFTTQHAPTSGQAWRARSETLELLRSLAQGVEPAGPAMDRASRLLNAYMCAVLGREIPAGLVLFGPLPR
jgi:DNA repair protein RecO (recombination protein O)